MNPTQGCRGFNLTDGSGHQIMDFRVRGFLCHRLFDDLTNEKNDRAAPRISNDRIQNHRSSSLSKSNQPFRTFAVHSTELQQGPCMPHGNAAVFSSALIHPQSNGAMRPTHDANHSLAIAVGTARQHDG